MCLFLLLTIDYPAEYFQIANIYHDFNSHNTNYERIGFSQFHSGFNREILIEPYKQTICFFSMKLPLRNEKTSVIQLVDKHFVQTRININIGDFSFTTWMKPKVKNSSKKLSIRIHWMNEITTVPFIPIWIETPNWSLLAMQFSSFFFFMFHTSISNWHEKLLCVCFIVLLYFYLTLTFCGVLNNNSAIWCGLECTI